MKVEKGEYNSPVRLGGKMSTAPAPTEYDAFISYCHEVDQITAEVIQAELQRFGKPWYRRRVLHVFRDNSNLAANPALWQSIRTALDSSRFLIVLCSPEAARSEWVVREVEYWLANKSAETLLVAVTGGSGRWCRDREGLGEDSNSSFPAVIIDALPEEPRWVDLRWVRNVVRPVNRDPRLRESIADLAAPIHGRVRDDLIGEDLRQHRRMGRWRSGAIALLSVLLLISGATTVAAYRERNTAITQRDTALAKQLALRSQDLLSVDPSLAEILAAEAYKRLNSPETVAALLAVSGLPQNLVSLHSGATKQFLGNDLLATVGGDRSVTIWNTSTASQLYKLPPAVADVRFVEFNPIRHLIAVASEWQKPLQKVNGVQVGDLDDYANRQTSVTLWNSDTGAPAGALANLPGFITSISFSPDGQNFTATFGYELADKSQLEPDGRISFGTQVGTFGETWIWHLTPDLTASRMRFIPGSGGYNNKPHWTDPVIQAYYSWDNSTLITVDHQHRDAIIWSGDKLAELARVEPVLKDGDWIDLAMPMTGSLFAIMLHNDKASNGSLYSIQIWDWKAKREVQDFATEALGSLGYDTDTQTIQGISPSSGELVKWNLSSSQPVMRVAGPSGLQNSDYAQISDKQVAYLRLGSSEEYDSVLWDIDPQSIVQKICQRRQSMDTREWAAYVGAEYPYRPTCS